jgi:hypothetical protein
MAKMSDNDERRIEYLKLNSEHATDWFDIDSLRLWDGNPNEGNIGNIITSIQIHGFNDTCHYWRGVVKAGNHSVIALRQLRESGWHPNKSKITSTCLRINDGMWEIAMLDISEMGKEQSDAFGIRINQSQRDGSWNEVALASLLQEVANSTDVALSSTGFDADELDDLLRDLDPANHVQFAEYDESIANTVEYHECPNCGHKFPK